MAIGRYRASSMMVDKQRYHQVHNSLGRRVYGQQDDATVTDQLHLYE